MKLSSLVKAPFDEEITSVCCDSRDVEKGALFICIKGEHSDGHDFASLALKGGAAAIVCEKSMGLEREIVVGNTRLEAARIFSKWYGEPSKRLKIYGVTGTNGKTSTVAMLEHMYNKLGVITAAMGTLGFSSGEVSLETGNTTALPEELYRLISRAADIGCEKMFMEVSSHALSLSRVEPMDFEACIHSGVTPDHLDFHRSIEEYAAAKEILFTKCKKGVFNADNIYSDAAYKRCRSEKYTFSVFGGADFTVRDVTEDKRKRKMSYTLLANGRNARVELGCVGSFALYNSLAAFSLALCDGADIDRLSDALSDFEGVKGRMEIVYDGLFTVIIDYAHTPDALERAIAEARGIRECTLLTVVFGCGGNRDREKRSVMGRIAESADRVIVTGDNPRYEKNEDIIGDILCGSEKAEVIKDRRAAIEYAIDTAQEGEIILIAGKGHEEYESILGEKKPFSERKIIKNRIADLAVRKDGE